MLKRISIAIISVLIVLTALLNACNSDSGPKALSKEDSLKLKVDRGSYLVHSVTHCTFCHSQLDFNKFSMPVIPGTEGGGGIALHEFDSTFPGKVYFPNITPHGLKDWTDAEIARAITQGINKAGDTLLPIMPYHDFSNIAKEDVESIIAYLHTLTPIEKDYPKRELFIPVAAFGGGPLPANDYTNNVLPDSSDKVKYGGYLVSIAGCAGCHNPLPGNPMEGKLFAGGNEDKFPSFIVRSANLTPDTATGIGGLTEEMFIAKFRNNASPEVLNREAGRHNTLMPWSFFGTMKDNDLKAIYAYLRTMPPVKNIVVKWPE